MSKLNLLGGGPQPDGDHGARPGRIGMIPPEEASVYELTDRDQQILERLRSNQIEGTPEQVREQLLATAQRYRTDDLTVVTNAFYFEDRLRSFELVADVMGLHSPVALIDLAAQLRRWLAPGRRRSDSAAARPGWRAAAQSFCGSVPGHAWVKAIIA